MLSFFLVGLFDEPINILCKGVGDVVDPTRMEFQPIQCVLINKKSRSLFSSLGDDNFFVDFFD